MDEEQIDEAMDAEPEPEPWVPSAVLRGRLLVGSFATVVGMGIGILASVVQMLQGETKDFTAAEGLELLSWLPLVVVLWVYLRLAREVGSERLFRNALGLFGSFLLFDLLNFGSLIPPELGWIIWAYTAVGILVLLAVPFLPFRPIEASEETAPLQDDLEAPHPDEVERPASNSKAAILVGMGIAILIFLKLVGKTFLMRAFSMEQLGQFVQHVGVTVLKFGFPIIALMSVLYPIGFGWAKIREHQKLGDVAAQLGWVEILGLMVYLPLYMLSIQIMMGGGNGNHLSSEQMMLLIDGVSIVIDVAWTVLTVMMFMGLRARYQPQESW